MSWVLNFAGGVTLIGLGWWWRGYRDTRPQRRNRADLRRALGRKL